MSDVNRWELLSSALKAVGDCAPWVYRNSAISYVGFRSHSNDEWLAMVRELNVPEIGTMAVRRKGELGQRMVFIKLACPHILAKNEFTARDQSLRYLELPEPQEQPDLDEPKTLAVFYSPTLEMRKTTIGKKYDMREQMMTAERILRIAPFAQLSEEELAHG